MSFLALRGLEKTYDDGTKAVRGIDLSIAEGEFVVLLGPSGCGKTSTLRMLAGLEIATAGSVAMQGADVTKLRPSQRDIGMVFQFYALYPHMTVEKNLRFPLDVQGLKRTEQDSILKPVIERLGIGPLLKRYPRQLSGGDQQRISLGRALVRRPKLFLMDEPLGTLDADQRMLMREFIREQQQELGVTTIYVTHDQEEAMSLADRIVVMSAGEICQDAAPAEIYERPRTTFVAHFVGSPGMNMLNGRYQSATASFVSKDQDITVAMHGYANLAINDGADLQLGIRSEYIYLDADAALRARVLLCEYMGHCQYAHLEIGGQQLRMRLSAQDHVEAGQSYGIRFDEQHLNVYDQAGQRL